MACASAVAEMAHGKTFADLRQLRRDHVIAAVGGVPPASGHAAQLALDALTALLGEIKT